jgi:hypothetical protein
MDGDTRKEESKTDDKKLGSTEVEP